MAAEEREPWKRQEIDTSCTQWSPSLVFSLFPSNSYHSLLDRVSGTMLDECPVASCPQAAHMGSRQHAVP